MAIYINKAGTKVDEAVVGTKSAEDWASQGFSAYNPTAPTTSTTQNPPAGSVAIPKGQIDQYNVLGQIGETGTPGSYLYGTKKAIDATALGEAVAPVKLPEVTQGQDPSGMVAGATATQKTLQDYINEISKTEKTQAQTAQSGFLDQIAGLTKELEGRGAEQLSAEEKLGLPTMTKELADLNAQITTKLAEYNDANIRIEGDEMARVGSSAVSQRRLSQKQSQLMREKASEIGLLQARALGVQGNIQAAQETANRAIDLKYSTIEAQLNTYEAQLRAIQPLLNEEQTIRAEARQQMLYDQREALAEKKEEEKLAFNLQLEGYTKISGPSGLAGLTEADILRLPNGDIYRKPQETIDAESQMVQSYVNQIRNGSLKIANVPAEVRGAVVVALGDTPISSRATSGGGGEGAVTGQTIDLKADMISQGFQEGDILEDNGKFYVVGVDGKARTATAEEKKLLTEGAPPEKYGWNEAEQFVADNEEATDEQLRAYLLKMVNDGQLDLTSTQINAIIKAR
jgi:hypothetical protein